MSYQNKVIKHPEIYTISVSPTPDTAARTAADAIISIVKSNPTAAITWATGNTQRPIHEYLITDQKRGLVDFSGTHAFHLDEYWPCNPDEPHSFVKYLQDNLLEMLDIPRNHINVINGTASDPDAEANRYDRLLKNIHLAILGIGPADDPHIGFNPSGTNFSLRTHLANLTESTKQRDQIDRDQRSPNQAITQGIANICEADHIFLIAYGKKGEGLRPALYDEISSHNPASALRTVGGKVTIFLDEEAAGYLKG